MEVNGQLQAPANLVSERIHSIGWALEWVRTWLRREQFCPSRKRTISTQFTEL